MKKRMRMLTIFVRHGTVKYARSEQHLAQLFHTQLPAVERHIVVVDTALPVHEIERQPGRVVIGGDNSWWEFSAFDAALSHVGDEIWNYDLVNLTTSAFRESYVGYLDRFRPDVLESIVGRPACLGHIDCYNDGIEVLGCASQHWVRSSCLFLPPTELKLLGTLVSTPGRDQWFSGDPAEPFRPDAPLSASYRQFIIGWLTGEDIGQDSTWHSRIGRNAADLHRFEQKTLAILNEHLLGIRLRAVGCRTIDVTWLSALLARRRRFSLRRRASLDWNTPWWRQLADRDRETVHVDPAARIA